MTQIQHTRNTQFRQRKKNYIQKYKGKMTRIKKTPTTKWNAAKIEEKPTYWMKWIKLTLKKIVASMLILKLNKTGIKWIVRTNKKMCEMYFVSNLPALFTLSPHCSKVQSFEFNAKKKFAKHSIDGAVYERRF